jgi:hypothetical protein
VHLEFLLILFQQDKMNLNQNEKDIRDADEKPPILKTWNNIYSLVFLNLVILIIFFYIFTKVFE